MIRQRNVFETGILRRVLMLLLLLQRDSESGPLNVESDEKWFFDECFTG